MKKLVLVLIVSLSVSNSVKAIGGHPELKLNIINWVKANINYPKSAVINKEEGVVYVSFEISENNKATNIKIEQGVSKALDKEVLKVLDSMTLAHKFDSKTPNKRYTLPIKFTIK